MKWTLGVSLMIWIWCADPGWAQQSSLAATKDDGDNRTPVVLVPAEKAYVFEQMRLFVASIQSIAAGLADGDRKLASEAAAERGFRRNANDPAFPPTLGPKLPADWKQLGGTMRKGFDRLSDDIAKGQDVQQSLGSLSKIMTNCVSCHATYRVVNERP